MNALSRFATGACIAAFAGSIVAGSIERRRDTQQAELTTGLIIASIALGGLAYLTAKKPKTNLEVQSTPTTLTTRGSVLVPLNGRRKCAPIFAWAGNREVRQEGGGGGKGGKPKAAAQNIYYEEGSHLLRVGPIDKLHRIYRSGKVLWEGPIDRYNTPSGTQIETSEGTFAIWWGTVDQPVNTWLGHPSRVGINSRWPYMCRVDWISFRQGTSAIWPQLEYEIEATSVGSELNRSLAYLAPVAGDDDGPNVGHVLYQYATARWPHGGGARASAFDTEALERVGVLGENERIAVAIDALNGSEGRTAAEIIGDIMQEHGIMLSQVGDKLVFFPIREVITPPEFAANAIVGGPPLEKSPQGEPETNRVVWLFADRTLKFKPNTARSEDEATSRTAGRKYSEQTFQTITHGSLARAAADRKELEAFAALNQYTMKLGFTARNLWPGMQFSVEGFGPLRCNARRATSESTTTEFEVVRDVFSYAPTGYDPGDGSQSSAAGIPTPDTHVVIVEMPYEVVGAELAIGVVRVRGSKSSGAAIIHLSANGTSYDAAANQTAWASGGTLQSAMSADVRGLIEEGPVITAFNTDILGVLDLSGDRTAWLSGRQMVLIDDELYCLRNLTAVTGGYRLDGLIPAQGGTVPQAHAVGAKVYIFRRDSITVIRDTTLTPGATVYVKSQPPGVSLEAVTAVSKNLKGYALAALPPNSIWPPEYKAGETWVGTWRYRVRDGSGNAAGEQTWGAALTTVDGEVVQAPPDGPFVVEIFDSADLSTPRRTVSVTDAAFGYTQAMRGEDFSSSDPDSFVVAISNAIGARRSRPRVITVRRQP